MISSNVLKQSDFEVNKMNVQTIYFIKTLIADIQLYANLIFDIHTTFIFGLSVHAT